MDKTHGGDSAPDAIDLLKEDHKRVQKLFKEFGKADRSDGEALQEIVETACMELQIHAMVEEEIFYPAVRARLPQEKLQLLLNKPEVEHEAAEDIIAKLQELEPDDEMYTAYFTVLSEQVKHHIKEEEKTLFPEVKKHTGIDLTQLAADMRQRREELFAEIESGEEEVVEDDQESIEEDSDETLLSADEADETSEDDEERWTPERRH
jgi:iron-sulfur cluster repair protein YtfE (RIC family)